MEITTAKREDLREIPELQRTAFTKEAEEYSTGALVKDKNCPLAADKELLTFDVQEFPILMKRCDQKD